MERKKTLSLVSTIMMTIYAALVTIFNLWMFAMAAVLGQLVGKNSTERLMIDGTVCHRGKILRKGVIGKDMPKPFIAEHLC